MTFRRASRPAVVRELRGLVEECTAILTRAQVTGWHDRHTVGFAGLVMQQTNVYRPRAQDIQGLRWVLQECIQVIRLRLPSDQAAQARADQVERILVRTYPYQPRPEAA